jgi:hypothetical protein
MRISLKRFIATSLVAALSIGAVDAAPRPAVRDGAGSVAPVTTAVVQQAPDASPSLVGRGIAQKLACMACAGSFLLATGTGSIAALIIVVGLNPELATACVVGCIAAFA